MCKVGVQSPRLCTFGCAPSPQTLCKSRNNPKLSGQGKGADVGGTQPAPAASQIPPHASSRGTTCALWALSGEDGTHANVMNLVEVNTCKGQTQCQGYQELPAQLRHRQRPRRRRPACHGRSASSGAKKCHQCLYADSGVLVTTFGQGWPPQYQPRLAWVPAFEPSAPRSLGDLISGNERVTGIHIPVAPSLPKNAVTRRVCNTKTKPCEDRPCTQIFKGTKRTEA